MIKIDGLYYAIEEEIRRRYGTSNSKDFFEIKPIHLKDKAIRGLLFGKIFQIKNDQEDKLRVITPVDSANLIFGEVAEIISSELGVKPTLSYEYYSSKIPIGELIDSNLESDSEHAVISVLEWNVNKRIEYNKPNNYYNLVPRNIKMLNRGKVNETPRRSEYSCFLSSLYVFNSIMIKNKMLPELKKDTERYLKLHYGIDTTTKYNLWFQDQLNLYGLTITDNGIFPLAKVENQGPNYEYIGTVDLSTQPIDIENTIYHSCRIDSEGVKIYQLRGKGRRKIIA